MTDEQQAHIELIAQRLNVELLDEEEAAKIYSEIYSDPLERVYFAVFATSFSAANRSGTRRVLYLDHEEGLDDDAEYMVALHEMGHISKEHTNVNLPGHMNPTPELVLHHEQEAWEWAYDHMNQWPSDDAVAYSLAALMTYYDDNNRGIPIH